jgi:predicted transcriptional regulator
VTSKDLVTYQDKLYYIYKKISPEKVKDGYINDLKELWRCDVVVRNRINNDDTLLFLREIPELEIVKDII